MTAIGYIRVSTEDQAKEGISLDSQRSKIQAYCHLKDLTLREIVEDAGISAKNLRRPGAQKVLKLARRKEIDAVVVHKLDRFFRSTMDALETTKVFDKWGVSFHSIEETLDTRSAMGRFFFTLTAALAEMERRLIGERTKAALSHKRSRNEKTGGDIPFGYDLMPDGLLEKNDEEQGVIRHIRRLHDQGLSLRHICMELQREGHKTKRGNPTWHPETIAHIIKRGDSYSLFIGRSRHFYCLGKVFFIKFVVNWEGRRKGRDLFCSNSQTRPITDTAFPEATDGENC